MERIHTIAHIDHTGACFTPVPRSNTSVFGFVVDMIALASQRRALRTLDDAALRDMGISAKEAQTEATRPIWDLPQNWRR